MNESNLYVFCYGTNCLLKEKCRRYVDGQKIDIHASGYTWMSSCDVEHRSGFVSTSL
jgi:hypothetical protein